MRPWLVAKASGLKINYVQVKLDTPQTAKSIAKHSLSGKVPVLKYQNQTIWDSLAICETLAELVPNKNLWPADQATRAEARAYVCEMHSGFQSLRSQLSMDINLRMNINHLLPQTKSDIKRILQMWTLALKKHRGPYLFGEFTIADAFFAPIVFRFQSYGIKIRSPLIHKYMRQIKSNPHVKEWVRLAKKERPYRLHF